MSKLDLIEKDLLAILNKSSSNKNLTKATLELLKYVQTIQSECIQMLNSQQNHQMTQPPFSWEILRSDNSPFKTS